MQYQYNDGGRKEAGYQGDAGDCVVRAIAIATGFTYQKVYDDLFELNKQHNKKGKNSPRDGNTSKKVYNMYLDFHGFSWTPTMFIGSGAKVHLKDGELPMGRLVARCSRHLVAVIDGVLQDTYDSSRDSTRTVYGYWIKIN